MPIMWNIGGRAQNLIHRSWEKMRGQGIVPRASGGDGQECGSERKLVIFNLL
jgi:hypothetical protein